MINLPIPFYKNPDETHCFQACLKMALKYFCPEQDFSWKELEEISGKSKGKATWPMTAEIWLKQQGFSVHNIELFDYAEFAARGMEYFKEIAPETAQWSEANSDIPREQKAAQALVEQLEQERRTPTLEDIKSFLERGYVVLSEINGNILSFEPGFEGHMVLVKGYDEKSLFLNDPDLGENYAVSYELFEQAWGYSSAEYKSLIALHKALV